MTPSARSSTSPASGKSCGALFPDRRKQVIDDAVREHPAERACVSMHRVQVAVVVPSAERQPRNEVVQDEVVEDDEPPSPLERIHDPAVRVGIVADVVERDVGAARRLRRSPRYDA